MTPKQRDQESVQRSRLAVMNGTAVPFQETIVRLANNLEATRAEVTRLQWLCMELVRDRGAGHIRLEKRLPSLQEREECRRQGKPEMRMILRYTCRIHNAVMGGGRCAFCDATPLGKS